MVIHCALLSVFIGVCATVVTLFLHSITENPWICCFILAASTVLFTLENCALLSEVQKKDEEIEVLRSTHNHNLLQKVRGMEVELAYLRKERENQRLVITNLRLRDMHNKSASF